MAEDYYSLLGVSKTASADEIKKAFRKKAHELHPDKSGGDADKFKQVNEAYQVLGNPQKRQQYDQFGAAGPAGQGFGGASGFNQQQWQNVNMDFGDLGDIFGDLFGFGRSSRGRQANRGQDIEAELAISFRQAASGGTHTIELKHHVVCQRCQGQGGEPGSSVERCATCNGTGQVQRLQQTFLGAMQSVQPCPTCRGEGTIIKTPCKTCRGEGRESITEAVTVKIPAGIDTGQRIRIAGKGEAGRRGTPAGDLYLRIRVQPDKEFERDGDDLVVAADVPLTIASLGGTMQVNTLDGSVSVKVPAGTQSGKVIVLRGRGLPNVRGNGTGDLRIRVHVKIPSKLSGKQKKLLKELQDEGL